MPKVEQTARKSKKAAERSLLEASAAHFRKMVASIEERRREVELLDKILEKLEEIRYALVDNETGISNLLKQMKLTNRKLEELVDKRH